MAVDIEIEKNSEAPPQNNLGTLRLRTLDTQELILIPQPSASPNDPLNWSKGYKYYVASLSFSSIFLCTFVSAGPSIAIIDQTISFFGPPGPDLMKNVSKAAYFFTSTALTMGLSNLFWVPMAIKYGRRPVYVGCFALFVATATWAGVADSYGSELAARILLGFASGPPEVLGPLTLSDIFFLHERGSLFVIYTCMLNLGAGFGTVIAGLITRDQSWRVIYYVAVALVGFNFALMALTLPETTYTRPLDGVNQQELDRLRHKAEATAIGVEDVTQESPRQGVEEKLPWSETLRLWPKKPYTDESLMKMAFRPLVLVILPSVLWATLVMSVSIGFFVAVSSNFALAFATNYGMVAWQSGLCSIGSIVGALLAIFFGGRLSDIVADYLTTRNGGIREPEMRLPAMALSIITGPLSLVLYGVGIEKGLHWICPTIGLGLLTFTIVQAANIALVYMVDCYRPIAGEVTVTMYAFKSAFGFLLSFYTNTWVEKSGYANAFGAMAGITGAVLICVVPFFFFGKFLRRRTWNWKVVRVTAHWSEDREVGE